MQRINIATFSMLPYGPSSPAQLWLPCVRYLFQSMLPVCRLLLVRMVRDTVCALHRYHTRARCSFNTCVHLCCARIKLEFMAVAVVISCALGACRKDLLPGTQSSRSVLNNSLMHAYECCTRVRAHMRCTYRGLSAAGFCSAL